jgi:hypothetical protein
MAVCTTKQQQRRRKDAFCYISERLQRFTVSWLFIVAKNHLLGY